MTTTRELRTALRDVEPGFKGVEVAAIRAQARRIRTRRRVAGAVVGSVAVVTAAVSVPHLPFHASERSMQAAMPAGGSEDVTGAVAGARNPGTFRPRTGPLPKVERIGARVDVGINDYELWLKPSTSGGAGEACNARRDAQASCQDLKRQYNGLVAANAISMDGNDGPVLLIVAEAPIERVTASSWSRTVKPTIHDLGQGYVAVVALMPKQLMESDSDVLDEHVWLYDDKDQLVAGVGLQDEAAVKVDPGVDASASPPHKYPPVTSLGKPVTVGLNGEQMWMAPPTDDSSLPVVCTQEKGGDEESCSTLNLTPSSLLYTFAVTADPGKNVEIAVTDAKVIRATATMDGAPVPAQILDLGSGYLALRAVLDVGYGTERRIELHGFDAKNKEVVTSTVGVRLTK